MGYRIEGGIMYPPQKMIYYGPYDDKKICEEVFATADAKEWDKFCKMAIEREYQIVRTEDVIL